MSGATVLVTGVGGATGSRAAAAALACAGSDADRAGLLVDFSAARPPRAAVVALTGARELEERLAAHLPEAAVASKGRLCHLALPPDAGGVAQLPAALAIARPAIEMPPPAPVRRDERAPVHPLAPVAVHLPPHLLQAVLAEPRVAATGALLRADLGEGRPLLALAARDLVERRLCVGVLKRPLGWLTARLALLGALPPANAALPTRLQSRLLDPPAPTATADPRDGEARGAEVRRGAARATLGQRGQALVLSLGACFVLIAAALALVAIAGAVTGKGRAQRAADLAAISAARSMRDDLPRLLSPPTLPNGLPNPLHMEKAVYLARARTAAVRVARANEVAPGRLRVGFPDRVSFAPVRAKAAIAAEIDLPDQTARSLPAAPGGGRVEIEAAAVAEAAAAPITMGVAPSMGNGGGYGGPLVHRNGEGMRPDVAAAFDRMAASAARAGIALLVNSGFRSDAEQAELFAANPDPRWVAPPGKSLHRCATELDLGPESAYGWLAANAARFGFLQRYSWEAWHYGYTAGPEPCSPAAEERGGVAGRSGGYRGGPGGGGHGGGGVEGGSGDGALAGSGGLPSFVPARYRAPLLRAAARWNVSAALLAAQLLAESNFNPFAVSPAGAQGIAQFIPSTATAYDLRDPFDPEAAIEAQAHLMSDLLRQFGTPELALAAYNAGPAPVDACDCVPAYPETRAYVTRIVALLGGAGALALPVFEVRLVA